MSVYLSVCLLVCLLQNVTFRSIRTFYLTFLKHLLSGLRDYLSVSFGRPAERIGQKYEENRKRWGYLDPKGRGEGVISVLPLPWGSLAGRKREKPQEQVRQIVRILKIRSDLFFQSSSSRSKRSRSRSRSRSREKKSRRSKTRSKSKERRSRRSHRSRSRWDFSFLWLL